MNGWTEDDKIMRPKRGYAYDDSDQATDVRTRDLGERQRAILDGARPWGSPSGYTFGPDGRVKRMGQAHPIPRRIDWPRVAIFVGMCLLSLAVVLGIGGILVYVLTAF